MYQRTIKRPIRFMGIGLHLGEKVNVTIRSAPVDSGIVFIRTDLERPVKIKADFSNVIDTQFATTLGSNGVKIWTVEHLMAAFMGLGIDNAIIEVDSSEIPIMDGSASPFVYLLRSAGIEIQNKSKKFFVIKRPISVINGDKKATLTPYKGLKITCSVDYNHPLITNQSYGMQFSNGTFEKEICRARTFGFFKDIDALWDSGLAKGGSLDNVVILGDSNVMNESGLRFPDEFVRHKILDSIGDLSLLGAPVIGHLIAYKSGHQLNHELTEKVFSNQNNWGVIESFDEEFKKYNIPSFGILSDQPV